VDRPRWIRELRRVNERQEDSLSPLFDRRWGSIGEVHGGFVTRFLGSLPPGGRVLDAACGTGKYFGMVLESGRSVVGVDHSAGHLARARDKFPEVPTEKHDLQELPYRDEFDGVMCVDALEMVPPEDWPVVLSRFRGALRENGRLYLTVERVSDAEVREETEKARRAGLPAVEGEVVWADEDLYHYYPSMERVRAWLTEAGFSVEHDAEQPWEEGYTYHHVLAAVRG
jgi:cyclopropane fatty-acyl-phospholipid synthase-like methyltransferase